jgi:DNA-binding transcriptional ArsR family regulator
MRLRAAWSSTAPPVMHRMLRHYPLAWSSDSGTVMQVKHDADVDVSKVAAMIGEGARTRMLVALLDGRPRTGSELASVAGLTISTTSVHLFRLEAAHLVSVHRKGRNCYYRLRGAHVAAALQTLSDLATDERSTLSPDISNPMPLARSCYDHLGGTIAVELHDCFRSRGWLVASATTRARGYDLSPSGADAFRALGIDVEGAKSLRRTLAHGCLDWHEGQYHLGGALGAAFATLAHTRNWIVSDSSDRSLRVTDLGRQELLARWGISDLE